MTYEELKNKFPDSLLDKSTIDERSLQEAEINADTMYYLILDNILRNYFHSVFFKNYLKDNSINFNTNPIEFVAIEVFEKHFDEIKEKIFSLFNNKDDIIKYIDKHV